MPRINPTRQRWLSGLQQQLSSGKWGQVIQTFYDEPLDPANEYPWEPCAIVKRVENGKTVYMVLVEEISSDLDYKRWAVSGKHSTYEDALREVVNIRPWGFR